MDPDREHVIGTHRHLTGFNVFLRENIGKYRGGPIPPMKSIGEAWGHLSIKKKEVYNAIAERENNQIQPNTQISGFGLFFRERFKPYGSPQEMMSVAIDTWRKLSANEKNNYNIMARRINSAQPN